MVNICNLLRHLELHNSRPRTSTGAKFMQDIVKRHHFLDPGVNDGLQYLPKDLNHNYPPGARVKFREAGTQWSNSDLSVAC